MHIDRRTFITLSAGGVALGVAASTLAGKLVLAATQGQPIKAVSFDGLAIFDPRPCFKILYDDFPEQAEAIKQAWISRVFEYTWLRTMGEQYVDFTQIIRDALHYALQAHRVALSPEKETIIMDTFMALPVWEDVIPALDELKANNIRMAFVSNMSEKMLRTNMEKTGISDYFDHVLSTDAVKQFKPAPATYQMAVDAFGLKKEEIAFAAFGGWDAVGAAWFGHPTLWINRQYFPPEKLGPTTALEADSMMALPLFVANNGKPME